MTQLPLFADMPIEASPLPRVGGRPCTAGKCGRGPAGETCRSCRHLVHVQHHDYTYLKCGLMKPYWTHGAGSDIRAKWAACEHWAAKPKP